MSIRPRFIAVGALATIMSAGLLVGFATILLAVESTGATRVAWALISSAALLWSACCLAAIVAIPKLRQFLNGRRQRGGEPTPRQRSSGPDVAAIQKALEAIAREVRNLPDTARVHKLLEVTSRKTVQAINDHRIQGLHEATQDGITIDDAAP